jgi:hypothetical protein
MTPLFQIQMDYLQPDIQLIQRETLNLHFMLEKLDNNSISAILSLGTIIQSFFSAWALN